VGDSTFYGDKDEQAGKSAAEDDWWYARPT